MRRRFTKYPSSYVKASDGVDSSGIFIYGIKWDISEKEFLKKAMEMPDRVVTKCFGFKLSSYGKMSETRKEEVLTDAYYDYDYLISELFELPVELDLPNNIPADFEAINAYLKNTYGYEGYGYTIMVDDDEGYREIPYT